MKIRCLDFSVPHKINRICGNNVECGYIMRDIVLELLSSYGYAGMFALILIENLFPPIPSEVILTFGGFMTTYTRMNIAGGSSGSDGGLGAGALILYELGRHIPVQKFYAFWAGHGENGWE